MEDSLPHSVFGKTVTETGQEPIAGQRGQEDSAGSAVGEPGGGAYPTRGCTEVTLGKELAGKATEAGVLLVFTKHRKVQGGGKLILPKVTQAQDWNPSLWVS